MNNIYGYNISNTYLSNDKLILDIIKNDISIKTILLISNDISFDIILANNNNINIYIVTDNNHNDYINNDLHNINYISKNYIDIFNIDYDNLFDLIYLDNSNIIYNKNVLHNIIVVLLRYLKKSSYLLLSHYDNTMRKVILEYVDNNILFPIIINKNSSALYKREEFNYNIMYPVISFDILHNYEYNTNVLNDISKYFEINTIINEQSYNSDKKLYACSLFCQNSFNSYPNEYNYYTNTNAFEDINNNNIDYSINFNNKNSKWYNKYMDGLKNTINRIELMHNNNISFRIYLEYQLESLINEILSYSNNNIIEIYLMKENSIGACPGTLWRLMALDDINYNMVLCIDIDNTNEIDCYTQYFNILDKDNTKGIGRYLYNYNYNIRNDVRYGCKGRNRLDLLLKTYTPIIANRIVSRPSLLVNYNIKNIIIQFTTYHIQNNIISNIFYTMYSDYSSKIWTIYGFEETFLKHVLFPKLVHDGLIITLLEYDKDLLEKKSKLPIEFQADINFVQSNPNNTFVYIWE